MRTLSAILFENGLPDLPISLIEPHRNKSGVWRIKFCYDDGEPLSMDQALAATLVTRLREAGETDLALEIDDAVQRSRRYASM
jgi:hypothetical protein